MKLMSKDPVWLAVEALLELPNLVWTRYASELSSLEKIESACAVLAPEPGLRPEARMRQKEIHWPVPKVRERFRHICSVPFGYLHARGQVVEHVELVLEMTNRIHKQTETSEGPMDGLFGVGRKVARDGEYPHALASSAVKSCWCGVLFWFESC